VLKLKTVWCTSHNSATPYEASAEEASPSGAGLVVMYRSDGQFAPTISPFVVLPSQARIFPCVCVGRELSGSTAAWRHLSHRCLGERLHYGMMPNRCGMISACHGNAALAWYDFNLSWYDIKRCGNVNLIIGCVVLPRLGVHSFQGHCLSWVVHSQLEVHSF
jgi:hypothetical protein